MASEESDDEPLAVLAANKKLDPQHFFEKLGLEIDVEYDPKPKKRTKKIKNIVVKKEPLSIHFDRKLKMPLQSIVQRPEDVWLYLKDLNIIGPYSCLLCSEWFISRAKVMMHYILNHKKDYCGICRYFVTDKEAWEAHLKFHTPWPCSQCDLNFQSEPELRQHLSAVHTLVHCRLCHFRVSDDEQYHYHLHQKHNVTNVSRINEELVWEMETDDVDTYLCILCSRSGNPFTTFFSHYLGYHHFTIKCISSIVGGRDVPFTLLGADLSRPFLESLKDQGKCGYVDLDRNKSAKTEYNIKNEDDFKNLILMDIKEEVLSDAEEPKKEIIIRDDFDAIKTYKGIEDFDVTQMEVVVLQKNYFDYINQTVTDINSNIVPENSNIDYAKGNSNIDVEIDCVLCKTRHNNVEALAAHMTKTHSVISVPYFSCRVCVTTFESTYELDHHITQELGDFEDLWLCQFCDKEFEDRVSTRSHLSEHQDVVEYDNCFSPHLGFKCRYCSTLFWNEPDREEHQIKVHYEKNKENYYTCECNEIFSDKIWFTYHYLIKHQEANPSTTHLFKCCICSVVLSTVKQMRSHFGREHPDAKKVYCSLEGCQYRPLSHRKSFQLHLRAMHRSAARACSCAVCGREFPTSRACSAHVAQAHGPGKYKCQLCKLLLNSMDERKLHYLLSHPGKHPFSCIECGKSFLYKSSLYMHKKEHSSIKQDYTCEICHKVFAKRDSYREHQLIHEGPRHACSYCPMRFVQRSNMLRHERRHTGERPYTCPHCDRTFADKGACTSHVRTHNKDTTYDCLYCGQSFVQKSKLTYHIRRHTGENLETCNVCSKLFTSACSLREHMKTHEVKKSEKAKCPICSRMYQDERYMLRHVRSVHTAARRPCPLCGKQLAGAEGLRQHVLTHSRRKMFWCKCCPKAFNIKRTVVRHLRRRHGLKASEINFKDFYKKLDPRDCQLKLDEGTMTSIFGPPKKNVGDVLIGDFVTFPNNLNLPPKPAEDNKEKSDEDDNDEGNDNDNETKGKRVAKEMNEPNDTYELEPTDFVSVKIEPMDE